VVPGATQIDDPTLWRVSCRIPSAALQVRRARGGVDLNVSLSTVLRPQTSETVRGTHAHCGVRMDVRLSGRGSRYRSGSRSGGLGRRDTRPRCSRRRARGAGFGRVASPSASRSVSVTLTYD
jgi:hypothetical protein